MARKSLKDEVLQMTVINKSWAIISDVLNSKLPEITQDMKRAVALEIVKKTCPKEIKFEGQQSLRIFLDGAKKDAVKSEARFVLDHQN